MDPVKLSTLVIGYVDMIRGVGTNGETIIDDTVFTLLGCDTVEIDQLQYIATALTGHLYGAGYRYVVTDIVCTNRCMWLCCKNMEYGINVRWFT